VLSFVAAGALIVYWDAGTRGWALPLVIVALVPLIAAVDWAVERLGR
jgi:hypothetical protein